MNWEREAMWISMNQKAYEFVSLQADQETVAINGWIIQIGEEPYRIDYNLTCDSQWRVRKVEIHRLSRQPGRLLLRSNETAQWSDSDGKIIEGLSGCIDVDIFASPFTNTIPIRRLHLKQEQPETIRVAFVHLPGLAVTPTNQRYTLLRSDSAGELYRYEGLDSGFQTELPVDSDGLVIVYPELAKRIWISSEKKRE